MSSPSISDIVNAKIIELLLECCRKTVIECSSHYGFSSEEALGKMGLLTDYSSLFQGKTVTSDNGSISDVSVKTPILKEKKVSKPRVKKEKKEGEVKEKKPRAKKEKKEGEIKEKKPRAKKEKKEGDDEESNTSGKKGRPKKEKKETVSVSPIDDLFANLVEKEETPEVDVVNKMEFQGTTYLKSKSTGIIYNMDQDVVGKWNENTKTIDFEEEEEEEEEYEEE